MKQILLTGWVLLAAVSESWARDISEPMITRDAQALSLPCLGCHSPTDNRSIPVIHGMHEQTLIRIMQTFQSGDRPATVMGHIAKGYSRSDLSLIATFFARPDQP